MPLFKGNRLSVWLSNIWNKGNRLKIRNHALNRRTEVPLWCHEQWLGIFLSFFMLFSGCALVDEGAVDIRRTLKPSAHTTTTVGDDHLVLEAKNFSLGDDARISEGDSVSIHLRTAFIKDFFEILPSPARWTYNGEIAVVANAFEMQTGKELDFKDLSAGRLVYYSDDVEKAQFLNFNNLPVYGPTKFEGGPFALRFTIFELDNSSEQTKAILGTLATVGGAAYPPAAPILSLLNGLGQSLASGRTNDIVFRYDMVLDARRGFSRLNHFALESGNYVIVRSQTRQASIPWDKLELRENEARLYHKDTGQLYTEKTYLVVEVNKDVSSRDIELAQNTFDDLLKALEADDKSRAARITTAVGPLIQLALDRRVRVDNYSKAKTALADVRSRINKSDPVSIANNREDTEKILDAIAMSVDASGKWVDKVNSTTAALTEPDVEYFVRRLRELAQEKGKLTLANSSLFSAKAIKADAASNFQKILDTLWK